MNSADKRILEIITGRKPYEKVYDGNKAAVHGVNRNIQDKEFLLINIRIVLI